ncbi:citrate lyase ACP [Pasteurellaceae bacterium Macca]|nr:citrate lyase ACP [Pasteurellaceae bacterium Macca]
MNITKVAVAGTLESSDVLVRIEPATQLDIELNSSVIKQFGDDILNTVHQILNEFGVRAGNIIIDDKGALDCVLRARLKTALARATDEEMNWEKML